MINPRQLALLLVFALVLFLVVTMGFRASEIATDPRPLLAAEATPAGNAGINAAQSGALASGAAVQLDAAQVAFPTPDGQSLTSLATGEHLPLMIRWSNWEPAFGPALVYTRERDLAGMLSMQGPVQKMLMVTAFDELERLMARSDQLHSAGVTIVGLNTENGPGMTPEADMQTLDSPDPNVNFVARAARLATEHGFDVLWGPVRNTTDAVSDAAVRTMMEAGMRGLALQEQKFIEVQPAQARLAQVNQTRDRYLRLARDMGIDNFSFHVQIMHQRCPNLDNCIHFVQMLEEIPVDSIAIWSNGPIPPDFVNAIRRN